MSFQATDRFLGKDYVRFILQGFWQSRSGKMPDKCVFFHCNNQVRQCILLLLHPIPFEGRDEPEKWKQQKQWVDFVKSKHAQKKKKKNMLIGSSRSTRLCAQNICETAITKWCGLDWQMSICKEDYGRRKLVFAFSQRSKHLVFRGKVNQKVSKLRGRWEMHLYKHTG